MSVFRFHSVEPLADGCEAVQRLLKLPAGSTWMCVAFRGLFLLLLLPIRKTTVDTCCSEELLVLQCDLHNSIG